MDFLLTMINYFRCKPFQIRMNCMLIGGLPKYVKILGVIYRLHEISDPKRVFVHGYGVMSTNDYLWTVSRLPIGKQNTEEATEIHSRYML